jgi:(2Fe-2S) ferredoxin
MSFYKTHIFCCTNERPAGHVRGCCKEKSAETLRNYMKARVKELGIENCRINTAGCLDRCELGPVMVIYPEGIWYSCKTKEDVDEVIAAHLRGGEIVTRLQLKDDEKPVKSL